MKNWLVVVFLLALLGAIPAQAATRIMVDTTSVQTIKNKTFDTTNTFPAGLGGGTTINSGTTLPATCTVGNLFFKTDATAGQNLYECASTNVWTQQLNSGAGGASTALDNLAALSINSALLAQSGVDLGSTLKPFRHLFLFGGGSYGTNYFQLTGTPTSTRVLTVPDLTDTLISRTSTDTLTNKTLTAPVLTTPTLGVASATTINKVTITAPATGSTLTIADGVVLTGPSASATVATLSLTNTLTGRQDATGAASTGPAKTGTSIPGTCIVGDLFFKSDATAGQNLYQCASTNVFTQQLNSGAAGASTALSNLAAVNLNTSLLAQTGVDLGSTAKPFRDLYLFGGGTYATTYLKFTGTPTSTRTITVPDLTATMLTGTGSANQVSVYSGANAAPGSSTLTWDGTTLTVGSGNAVSMTNAVLTGNRTFTLPDANSNPVVPSTCSGTNVVSGISSGGVLTCVAGGTGSGTVNSGVDQHLTKYSATGTTLDDSSSLVINDTTEMLTIGTGPFAQQFEVAPLTADRIFHTPNANSVSVVPDTGAANNFLTAISAEGAITKAQPTVANLASSTSAALGTVLSDETGTGVAVFNVSPAITTPKITTSINDVNANKMLEFQATATAVDYFKVTNAATTGTLFFGAEGTDTHIGVSFYAKGNGGFALAGDHVTVQGPAAPAISGSCGTSPSVVGNNTVGKLTTGTGSPTSCVLTFNTAYTNAPICLANNETTANLARAVTTTTTVTISGTFVASDVITYLCIGRL